MLTKPWTVVLMRPDYVVSDASDLYARSATQTVEGETVERAIAAAKIKTCADDAFPVAELDDYQVISVFAGYLRDAYIPR